MLTLGVLAQVAGTYLWAAPAYLIPLLHLDRGLPLADAGLIAAAPTFGAVLSLILWGVATDRYGERAILTGGLLLAAGASTAAAVVSGYAALGVVLISCGAAGVSPNSASGRVVAAWFPAPRRGLAMGIRQMAQPLGVAIAALSVPALATGVGIWGPFAVAAVLTGTTAVMCCLGVRAAPGSQFAAAAAAASAEPNPYRASPFLARIHALSVLLVIPQFTLSTFGLVWLITSVRWSAAAAGAAVAVSQFVGALGRVAVGATSDHVGSRTKVLRWIAAAGVLSMLSLAGAGVLKWPALCALLLVIASTISVADNGLAFTSVTEASGPAWAGRALGIQNTGQFLAASGVGPVIGTLITAAGYPATFAMVALMPALALPLVPPRDRQWDSDRG
jgi:MFS family permease